MVNNNPILNTNIVDSALQTWRVNNSTNLLLLDSIPRKGLLLEPNGPRARNVTQIIAHLHHARINWIRFQESSAGTDQIKFEKGSVPSRRELRKALKESSKLVENFVRRAFLGKTKIKSFQKQPVRFLMYLIMHEAHHRGQLVYFLKQSGIRLPAPAARKMWEGWFFGKD